MNNIYVSDYLKELAEIFFPLKLYITGGYVRNSLLGLKAGDIDICSSAPPLKVVKLLENTKYRIDACYNRLGTLKISRGCEHYEYTVFREEQYSKGGTHKPHSVKFCSSLKKDALRRDFTVNAIYYDITEDKICDTLNGIKDLENKIIRAHNPQKIFASDGLRLLRMVRFACELNFNTEQKTFEAAAENYALLKDIKSERIFEELNKILHADGKYSGTSDKYAHYHGIKMLKEINVLPIIFTGIELCYGVRQREDFHKYDVFEHSAQTLKYSHNSIRLAALLHDIAKGELYGKNGNFYGHERRGAEIAAKLLGNEGLKCPKKLTDQTVYLIKNHMLDINNKTKKDKIKLFIAGNQKYFNKLMLLKQADYLGCGINKDISPTVLKWLRLHREMKEQKTPFSLKELNITGEQIAALAGKKEHISKILNKLFNDCVLHPHLNNAQILYQKAARYAELYNKRGML